MRLPRLLRRQAGAEVDRLYRKHSDEVFRYALMVMRSRPDAEDVTQVVFVRALRAIERGEKVRTPRNWLIKIAHNECRRLLSQRKVHAELPDEIAVEPLERADVTELRKAMAALPEAQRQALCLRELEGRTYVEIATALGLTVSAVETLIFRARRTLREQIEASISCEDFALLLDDPDARSRIRAHARVCADCATLERQARGRKSALKRIASMLGLPMWGTKLAAIGLTAAAVVATAAPASHHPLRVVPHSGTRSQGSLVPTVAPRLVVAPTQRVSRTHQAPHSHAAAKASVPGSARPPAKLGRAQSLPASAAAPPPPSQPGSSAPASQPGSSAPTEPAQPPAAAAAPTAAAPVATPTPTPAAPAVPAVGPPAPPVTVTTPAVAVPATPTVPVTTPPVETPAVPVPAVTVPVAAPPAPAIPGVPAVPAVPTVSTPVATPKVSLP